MNTSKLIKISDAILVLEDQTNTDALEIIDNLIGFCFDEENAGLVKQCCEDKLEIRKNIGR